MSIFSFMKTQTDINEGIDLFRAAPGAVLLDVRSKEEYTQGHIPGSVNLPLNRLAGIKLEKDTPLFVYCLSGARSARACARLKKNGYSAENIGALTAYRGTLEK